MLGLLLMAGMGFAATAIMDHIDNQATDDAHPPDEEEAPSHGSLLDDHEAHAVEDHAPVETHAHNHHDAHHQHEDHAQDKHQPAPHHAATQTDPPSEKVFGGDDNDTLHGTSHANLMEGNGGDDRLFGHGGNDNLVSFDAGHDTVFGNAGNDSLHGYLVQKQPGDLSYVVEDHQADHLHGGLGKDTLSLGSDDVGAGGHGADSFHVSWDVEHGHPAQITDYNPKQDKIYVEFTSNHADEGMTDIKPEEQTITTEPMKDGEGTAIMINGQAIAHVLGTTHLNASDIGLIHA